MHKLLRLLRICKNLNRNRSKAWDKQIEEDFSAGGAGMPLIEKWDAEINAGKSLRLEEFLAHRETGRKTK